jgi:type I restriction enzyme S subunit
MSSFIRLKDLIVESRTRCRDFAGGDQLEAFGVSNTEGIAQTAHRKSEDLSDYLVIEPGSFAYNPYRINVGSIGLTPDGLTGLVSPAYVVFQTKEQLIPEVLLDFLKSSEGLRQINKLASGAVRKALRFDDLGEIEIPAVTYAQQLEFLKRKRTFDLLHGQMLAQNRHQSDLLTKLKQAILQEAIQGKLTADWRTAHPDVEPASHLLHRIRAEKARLIAAKKLRPEKPLPNISPDEIPFEIPNGWEWCRLGNILNFSSGDGLTAAEMAGGDIPVFGGNGINGYHNKANIHTETIVVGRVGANCGAVHKTPARAWVTDNAFITIFSESCLTMDFLALLLRFLDLNHLSYDGSQPVISGKRVYPLPTPLPPLAEQAAIVERVEALMTTCRALEAEIEQSRTHAAHLLQAVLKEAFAPAAS